MCLELLAIVQLLEGRDKTQVHTVQGYWAQSLPYLLKASHGFGVMVQAFLDLRGDHHMEPTRLASGTMWPGLIL